MRLLIILCVAAACAVLTNVLRENPLPWVEAWSDRVEAKAQELGFTPLAAVKSWSYVGVDPTDQLLIGPAIAMPKALKRAVEVGRPCWLFAIN